MNKPRIAQTRRPAIRRDILLPESRRGATAVEFALVVPIILTLFLGAIEMTRLNYIRHSVANAAYEGARAGIIQGGSNADSQNKATQLLTTLGIQTGANVSVVSDTSAVTVTVSVPFDQNSWGIGRFTQGVNVVQTCRLTRDTL